MFVSMNCLMKVNVKNVLCLLSRAVLCKNNGTIKPRNYSKSYLFVSGNKAKEIYAVVQPYLDFDERFENLEVLKDNIRKRHIHVNVEELKGLWEFYKKWRDTKVNLELNRQDIANSILEIKGIKEKEKEFENLTFKLKMLKGEIKNVNDKLWDMENNVIIKALKLPNILDSRTPLLEEVTESFNERENIGKDHVEVGEKFGLTYIKPSLYYLQNELAQLEITVPNYFIKHFKFCNYLCTSNPDFSRSVLVEGCTLHPNNPESTFILQHESENDILYLTGGASFLSYFGLHAKNVVDLESLPIRYVAQGRQYSPKMNQHLNGLYSVWQSPAVEIFICTPDSHQMHLEFDDAVNNLISVYKSLDIHFRVVNRSAADLKPWEASSVSIQVFSPANETYVEIGNVSMIGDFISKRLRACYLSREKKYEFLHVIIGTAVKVPVLLGVLLEISQDKFSIPKVLEKFYL